MDTDRWSLIQQLYHVALELPPSARAEFLTQASPNDPELRREVESLLLFEKQADELLENPEWGSAGSSFLDSAPLSAVQAQSASAELCYLVDPNETAGMAVGRYQLLQKIGEGGMGEVWLAEQQEPVRRKVALKLVKAGMNSREVIARFESERQTLALMDHPAIAKVFDAGSAPQGAPYFVMEYVDGVPITTYCDNHRLNIHDRLELFMRVCEGVQHAHQKAIIHRDLKPSNILVTEVDGKAAPKIIDFGVAKALTQKLTVDTTFTRVGAMIGTPEYMSPEQTLSSGADIDTRTDVYSLGIVFYQLLAGAPPFELRNIAFDEFLRRLREEDAPKPSAKIRMQEPAISMELARKRQTEPVALARQMRGDLDSIALQALEKDRSRRYGSPSDFAADIRRHLNNDAVLAVAPSAVYRARKFARRYRGAMVTSCAFALVLFVAAVVSIRQGVRANREAAAAQAVNDFLRNDLLAQASASNQAGPMNKPDPDLKVRTALDRAAIRISERFGHQPEVEAAIRDTIGETYMDLGLYPEARTQFERSLSLHRGVLGAENPKTLKTMSRLGYIADLQGKYEEAERLLGESLKISRRLLGPEHPDTLYSMNCLANVYFEQGNFAQAETLQSQALASQRRVLGPEHPDTLKSMNSLAIVYYQEGKYMKAEALLSGIDIAGIRRRVLGPEHPDTLYSMNNLAVAHLMRGDYAQAEALFNPTLEIRRRVLGPEHPDTLTSMMNLAWVYRMQGKYAQAEALDGQVIETQRRVLGFEHPDTLVSMSNLGIDYCAEGRYAQAEALNGQAVEIQRRVLGPEHPDTLISMYDLAEAYTAQGKYARAEALFNRTLGIAERVLGSDHLLRFAIHGRLACLYQRQGKYPLAEVHSTQALAGLRRAEGPEGANVAEAAADLALTYQSQGKFAESEPLAREAVTIYRKKQPDGWGLFRAESLLGAGLAGQKKYAEAEPLLSEGYKGMVARKDRIAVPDRYHLDRAHEWLVRFNAAWGKADKAAKRSKK